MRLDLKTMDAESDLSQISSSTIVFLLLRETFAIAGEREENKKKSRDNGGEKGMVNMSYYERKDSWKWFSIYIKFFTRFLSFFIYKTILQQFWF